MTRRRVWTDRIRQVGKALPVVAVTKSSTYDLPSMRVALRNSLDHLEPAFSKIITPGDRVLVKVNMGCSGMRDPAARNTTHPAVVEAIIEAVLDCGGRVSLGDDVARAGRHGEHIRQACGMTDVAYRTGAKIVDFVEVGGREVASGLLSPASYFVTNAYFDADVVINAANCRSGPLIVGMSAAVKNMFGCVLGKRKELIHNLFGPDPRRFARAIADIHNSIPADLSILDMTTIMEGFGVSLAIQPVGLLLASEDPVALDTVAASVIGYDDLPMWTTYYGGQCGLGCSDLGRIQFRGVRWGDIDKCRLRHPLIEAEVNEGFRKRATRLLNATLLRPRPAIDAARCNGCGDCARRCPVQCISHQPDAGYVIDRRRCADCACCLKVCQVDAARLEFTGFALALRRLLRKDGRPSLTAPASGD